jgi:hypothetical protein
MKRATRTALKRAELTWPEAAWSVVDDDFDIRLRARVSTPDGDLHFEAWQVQGGWSASLALVIVLRGGAEMTVRHDPQVRERLLRSAIRVARDTTAVTHARALLATLGDDRLEFAAAAEAIELARVALSGVVKAGGIRAAVPAVPAGEAAAATADGGAP